MSAVSWNFYISAEKYFLSRLEISSQDSRFGLSSNQTKCDSWTAAINSTLTNVNSNISLCEGDQFDSSMDFLRNSRSGVKQIYQESYTSMMAFLTMSAVFAMSIIVNIKQVMVRFSFDQRVYFGLVGCLICLLIGNLIIRRYFKTPCKCSNFAPILLQNCSNFDPKN